MEQQELPTELNSGSDAGRRRSPGSGAVHQPLQSDAAGADLTEEQLRREHAFMLAVLGTMGALVVVLDSQGRIVRFNRACERTTGYSFEEVRGKELWPLLIAQDEAVAVRSVFDELAAGRFPKEFENDWMTRDGRRRRIAWSDTAMLGKTGAVEYIIGTGIDITDRKQAQAALQRSEEALRGAERRLELAVDAARMGIFDHDVKTEVLVASNQLAKLWGCRPDQFGGTFESFSKCVHPDDLAELTASIKRAHKTGENHVVQYRVIWPDGSVHWLEGRARFLSGSQHAVGTVIDITERKIAEEQLLKHREQLRSLASQLCLTEEKERRRIAMDLHDSIGQNLALARLKLGNKPESGNGTPSRTDQQLDQARHLIDEAMSSVQSLTYELCPPILYDLGLEPALEWLGEQFQARNGLTVVFSDDQQPKPVGDELRFLLFRAARELLVNVVKHAEARTALLFVRQRGQCLEMGVEDDGKGFAAHRGSGPAFGATNCGGGIGLFSIRERVEHFGGRLEVSSLSAPGTRVVVIVPLQGPAGESRVGTSDHDRGG